MQASWSGYRTIDPTDLEARFANEDGMSYMDSIFTEPTEEDLVKIDQIRGIVEFLPPREADFIELYYFRRLHQTDIATLFGVSQPTVCYRLARAADRIRFLLHLPKIERDDMTRDLAGFLSDPLDVQIMIHMWETTCQSVAAKRLGVSQGLVRHRFLRSLSRMKTSPKFASYVTLFEYISTNLNILREVQRPSWSDRTTRCLS